MDSPSYSKSITVPSSSSLQSNQALLSTLNTAIQTVNVIKDLVPLELAKGVLSTISGILVIIKDIIRNREDFIELVDQCNKISIVIWRATSGVSESELSPTIRNAISELKKSLDDIQDALSIKMHSRIDKQVFHVALNREAIAGCQRNLDRLLVLFNTELHIAANLKLDDLVSTLEELRNNGNLKSDGPSPDVLPAVPPIFFGRDAIVRETVESLLKCHHVALIGPGGIGKSCIAKAVLNDNAISTKFNERRYFVRYDDIDQSQVTHGTFLNRIARTLGIKMSKANQHSLIVKALSSSETLLVLDNAETFLDAALDAGQIAESLDDLGARTNVAIMMTTRTTVLPSNLNCTHLHVPSLEESPACQVFRAIYHPTIDPAILSKLLSSLDFHPLSINLLARAAVQNQWRPEELINEWEAQRANLLDNGASKIQSLTVTIEFSLNSPSLKKLGTITRSLLQVISFLPQGVNKTILKDLFPAIKNIQSAVDMLCNHSPTYRKENFITTLAPIRLYISTTYSDTSSFRIPILADTRRYYVKRLACDPVEEAWIKEEDVNLEHLVALGLAHCDTKNMKEACTICTSFIQSLLAYKPRPTSLRSVVLALRDDDPVHRLFNIPRPSRKKGNMLAKGRCLLQLASLAFNVGQITEARELTMEAENIFLACGSAGREALIACKTVIGVIYELLGNFTAAEEAYETALKRNPIFKSMASRGAEAWIHLALGSVRMSKGMPEAIEPTLKAKKYFSAAGDVDAITYAQFQIGQIELCSGKYENAACHFEAALSSFTQRAITRGRLTSLMAMLEVTHRQREVEKAKAFLDQLRETAQQSPNTDDRIDALTMAAAHVAMAGDLSQARDDINDLISDAKSSKSIDLTLMKSLYVAAWIELHANEHSKASKLFHEVIDQCEALSDVCFKAQAERALGEIAFLEKDFEAAETRFTKVESLCNSMGIAPELLYYTCYSHVILDDRFGGWKSFRDQALSKSL